MCGTCLYELVTIETLEAPKTTQTIALTLGYPLEINEKILLLETGGSELEASSLLAIVHSVEMCITDCWERNVINSFSHLWTLHAIILTCHTFTTFSPEKFQHRGWESCYVITPLAEKKNISFTKVPCITTQRNSSLYLQLHKICYFKIN